MSGGPKAPITQKDNLFSQDLVEIVVSFGEGVVWGLADGLKGFYVGNEPVLDDSSGKDVYNFPDFSLSMRQGYEDDLPVEFIMGGEASTISGTTSVSLPASVPRIFTTSPALRGKIRAVDVRLLVSALQSGDKSGATSQRACVFRIDYKKASDPTWTRIRNQTITDLLVSGTRVDILRVRAFNLGFLPEETENWTPKQWDLFEDSENLIRLNQSQGRNVAIVSRTETEGAFRNSRFVSLPKASWAGATIPAGGSPDYKAEYAADPSAFNTIYGKTTSGYIWELRIPLPIIEDDDWQIRVTRVSAELPLDDPYNFANISLDSIATVGEQKVSYPRACVAHITAQHSNRFSEIPDFSCNLMGILCDVPINYNPFNGTYDGIWLGGYKKSWTNNPVWILRELIMNPDWGDRSREPNIQVSDSSFYEASRYCDELIPKFNQDGGAVEYVRRHTFNIVIQEYRSSEDLKRFVAGSFRSILTEVNGQYFLNTDKQREPNFFVCPEMITSELFNYSATDLSSRFNYMRVSFQNAENRYQEDNRVLTNQEAIDRYGIISNDMQAVGCTNLDEALRQAAFNMLTNLKETIMVSFKVPRLGLYLKQYDNFYIADRTCGWGDSGRIHTKQDRVIKVLTPINHSGLCEMTVYTLSGLRTLQCSQLDPHTFEISESEEPVELGQDAPFILSSEQLGQPKIFRLMTVKDEGQGRGYLYTVDASEVYPEKYEVVDNLNPTTSGLTFSADRLIFTQNNLPPKPIAVEVFRLDYAAVGNSDVLEITITMADPTPNPNHRYQVAVYNSDFPDLRKTVVLDNNYGLISAEGALANQAFLTFEVTVIDQYQKGGETYYLLDHEILFKVGYERIKFYGLTTDINTNQITLGWNPLLTIGVYSDAYVKFRVPLGVSEVVYPISVERLTETDPVTDDRSQSTPYVGKGLYSAFIEYLNRQSETETYKEVSESLNWYEDLNPLVFEEMTTPDILNPNIKRLSWEPMINEDLVDSIQFVYRIDVTDPDNPLDPVAVSTLTISSKSQVDIIFAAGDIGKTFRFQVGYIYYSPAEQAILGFSRSWRSNLTAPYTYTG